jgi:isochorismate hydrolase
MTEKKRFGVGKRRPVVEKTLLMKRENALLVVVDVQEALVRAMDQGVAQKVIRNITTLLTFAGQMKIPVAATEQYPRGLGKTVPEIQKHLDPVEPVEKVSFSCCGTDAFNRHLETLGRTQILLTGMETHVCVLQTAADLVVRGFEVHVVADAVCSRRKPDWKVGLRWMETRGVTVTTTEIVTFQFLREAGTDEFKRLSKLFRA